MKTTLQFCCLMYRISKLRLMDANSGITSGIHVTCSNQSLEVQEVDAQHQNP